MAEYKLSATLELKDKFTAAVNRAKGGMGSFRQTLEGAGASVDRTSSSMEKMGRSAIATVGKVNRIKKSLEGIKGTFTTRIQTRDSATGTIRKVSSDIKALTGKTHTINVGIKQKVVGPLKTIKNKLTNAASGALSGLPTQMIGWAGVGLGVADTLRAYTDFTHQMSRVKAISGANDAEFTALTAKAREQGKITQFTAAESGKALEYMAMAGWKTEDMLKGLSGIMSLAAASGEDLGQVSDIVTDALSAFKLQAQDAGHFADVLAQAATNSNTNVGMMGYTFKYVAPLAGTLGFSIEDTALAIGLMANSGIKAEKAGTAMRSMFTRLAAPTKQSASAMAELGFSLTDSEGKVKSLRTILKELRKNFKGLSTADQTRLAKQLAGEDAISGFLAIMNESDGNWNKLADAVDHAQGAAKKMEKTSTDNLWGALKSAQSAWESVQLSFMNQGPGSTIKEFVDAVTFDLRKLSTALEKGFTFTDAVDLAKTAVQQLIDKFLQLDGVGSVLAGGTLVFGLKKIVSLLKNAKGLFKNQVTGIPGTGGMGATDMIVQANNVVVNGAVTSGGGAAPLPGGNGGSGASLAMTLLRWLPTFGAAAKTVYEVFNAEDKDSKTRAGIGGAVQTGVTALGTIVGGPAGSLVGFGVGQAINNAMQDPVWSAKRSDSNSEMYLNLGNDEQTALNGDINGDTLGNGLDMASRFKADMDNFKAWLFSSDAPSAMDAWGNAMDGTAERFHQDWADMKQTALDSLTGIGVSLTQACDDIGVQVETMKDSAQSAWEDLKQTVGTTTSEWSGYVDNAVADIEGALENLKNRGISIWESIKQSASRSWSDIGASASGSLAGASSWVANTSLGKWWRSQHNAAGAEFYQGGFTEINEHGGERIDLPNGSRIYPHATTVKMLEKEFSKVGSAGAPAINISGNTFVVRQESDIQKIAFELAQLIMQGQENYGGVMV